MADGWPIIQLVRRSPAPGPTVNKGGDDLGAFFPTEPVHDPIQERPAMDHIGMDVHKKESQICILTEGAS